MTLACLGSAVLQLVDNFLFSDPDLPVKEKNARLYDNTPWLIHKILFSRLARRHRKTRQLRRLRHPFPFSCAYKWARSQARYFWKVSYVVHNTYMYTTTLHVIIKFLSPFFFSLALQNPLANVVWSVDFRGDHCNVLIYSRGTNFKGELCQLQYVSKEIEDYLKKSVNRIKLQWNLLCHRCDKCWKTVKISLSKCFKKKWTLTYMYMYSSYKWLTLIVFLKFLLNDVTLLGLNNLL